ncbi:oligopeptidase A [Candidatus Blochmanniella vafra str. BVAF]|uniref:oligopeptidase A n=1 Tax=Blochmanniella vafra (strain BVAF) TaxID=859654 RepID=E8Q5W7_BLOVB|nr:M3 family metallopeptidase [Candidatus Blochmannia vafer]ADV33436.1 oligopeptidase A [Candidatus Blochmannia vafer str. BVAF]
MNKKFCNFDLPLFSMIKLNSINDLIKKRIDNCYTEVDRIVSLNKSITYWKDVYEPLRISENKLKKVWSIITHLNSVKHDLKLRVIYQNNLMSILEYRNWVNHHLGLYRLYKSLQNNSSYQLLSTIQQVALRKILSRYEISGIHLCGDKRKCYCRMMCMLSQLNTIFDNNVLDSIRGWKKIITDQSLLSGIPDDQLHIARLEAQRNQRLGWLFTLQYPVYLSVLSYCDNEDFRKELYWAFNTRASDQGPNAGKWDNTLVIDEILSLRYGIAKILGFNSYFEKSLQTKMIQNPTSILNFLKNLLNHVHPNAKKDFLKIQSFAKKYYSHKCVNPWDVKYFQEKQKSHLFQISEKELRFYFSEEKVLSEMFSIANRMYGIVIRERKDVDVWDSNVRFFDIFNHKNEWQGGFYLDLYMRRNKCEGAWMDIYSDTKNEDDMEYQMPIAYLICNFNASEDSGRPSLLTHGNIVTLFHEFGHVLHHILTSISISEISGVNGVELDVAEIPSVFMEKFCWDPTVLKSISQHYQTKNSLSNNMINDLLRLKTEQATHDLLKQIMCSLFDFKIHHEYSPKEKNPVLNIFNEIKQNTIVYPPFGDDRFPHSFAHIFSADDYAAGYYSYLWSDMLASSIWLHCKDLRLTDSQMGNLFLDHMVCMGQSIDFKQCFTCIKNKVVTTQAILKYYNIPIQNNLFFKLC